MKALGRVCSWRVARSAALVLLVGGGCQMDGLVVEPPLESTPESMPAVEPPTPLDDVEGEWSALNGANEAGTNLAGTNLGGTNLAGTNLGGVNLGGTNLAGTNLGGTNLGGNNLGGTNLGGTNLGGTNLGGTNLGGTNLGGTNLGGTNLGGTNLGGTNLAGNNLGGTNLGGTNLGGTNTGRNIHNLTGSINGMLYSAEDVWSPKTGQCIVMGLGSTAFPKLLGQQSVNAKISVALGKLPWGFASSSGGAVTLRAWEAIVWGDKTYCVFVMAAPPDATWAGVAGFVKAVFRWNAPPTQSMDISGIEAAKTYDAGTSTTITTYPGMMNAAARYRAGSITATAFVAGELAFITATTNNQSVLVDFASWVQDSNKNPLVLGNVTSTNPPTHAEALYIALDNGDGTVQVMIDDAASRTRSMPTGMTNSIVDLDIAYLAYQAGLGPKPVPRRCGGALFLNAVFGEPVPAGKCDNGLKWASGFCSVGTNPWTTVSGTTAPNNGYMQLTKSSGLYKRAQAVDGACYDADMKTVLSETYVHMWERNYDIPAGTCTPESNASFCSRRAKNCGSVTGTDNCGATRTVSSCGTCTTGNTCGGGGDANVCGNTSTKIYEAEAPGNTVAGAARTNVCYEGFAKTLAGHSPGQITGACWAGGRIRFLGNGSGNYVTIPVNVPSAGTYNLTVWAMSQDPRYYDISVNGGTSKKMNVDTAAWDTPEAFATTISLNAGNNTIKFFNASGAWAPDLDRIVIAPVGGTTPPPSGPSLTVHDTANASGWSVMSNFQIGSGGARPWPGDYGSTYVGTWNSNLNNLLGKTWIATKSASKAYNSGNQATIGLSATANVYLVVDDRWGAPPSIPYAWSSGWSDTGHNVTIRENGSTDRSFSVYKKTGQSGNVTLPKIGATNAFNYFIIIE
jgi:hypothetical protein